MSANHDSAGEVMAKVAAVVLAWFGSVQLANIQALVAIVSGLAVGAYAVLQFIALWKREFRK